MTAELLYGDARRGDFVTRDEYLARLERYRAEAQTIRYQLRRLWHRVILGYWEADAAFFDRCIWHVGGIDLYGNGKR